MDRRLFLKALLATTVAVSGVKAVAHVSIESYKSVPTLFRDIEINYLKLVICGVTLVPVKFMYLTVKCG